MPDNRSNPRGSVRTHHGSKHYRWSQTVQAILWIFNVGKLGQLERRRMDEFYRKLDTICDQQATFHDVTSKNIVMLFRALAKLKLNWNRNLQCYRTQLLFVLIWYADSFNPQGIANTLWAMVNLGINWQSLGQGLQRNLIAAINRNCLSFNPQEIANTLWAMAMLQIPKSDVVVRLFAIVNQKSQTILEQPVDGLTQLVQADIFYEAKNLVVVQDISEKIARDSAVTISISQKIVTNLVNDICNHANTSHPIVEHFVLFKHCDMVFLDKKIIIEIDGPHHYDSYGNLRMHDIFSQELLQKMGYRIHRIKLQEFERLIKKGQRSHIKEILQNLNVIPAQRLDSSRFFSQKSFSPNTSAGGTSSSTRQSLSANESQRPESVQTLRREVAAKLVPPPRPSVPVRANKMLSPEPPPPRMTGRKRVRTEVDHRTSISALALVHE